MADLPVVPDALARELRDVGEAVRNAMAFSDGRALASELLLQMRTLAGELTLFAGAGDAFDRPELVAVVVNLVVTEAAGAGAFAVEHERDDSDDDA